MKDKHTVTGKDRAKEESCPHCAEKKAAVDACRCEDKKAEACPHCAETKAEEKACPHCAEKKLEEKACPHCAEKKLEEKACCSADTHENEAECCCHAEKHESDASVGCASCCDLTPKYTAAATTKKIDKETISSIVRLSVSLAFLIVGFFDWHQISGGSGALMAFYYVNPSWVAVVLCGIPVFISAAKNLKNKKLSASVLISTAMIASIALEFVGFFMDGMDSHGHSYVFAAGEIAFLMELGELLENLTVKKCRSGIQRLVSLIPTEANVIMADGSIARLSLDKVKIGDRVLIKSGETVAVDGVVVKGSASIDQSSLTGEYLPVDVAEHDSVFGGTMNKNGVIEVDVTKLQQDMTIAKMAELTIEAEGKKSPISRLADKWSRVIVPLVFVTSVLVGLICGLATDIGTLPSVVRAITVLVVFCPCSLVLATPTAIAAGLGNSARRGVLVKSGASLEELSRVDTVCFDKTGTITEGKIELSSVTAAVGEDENELIKLAASAEIYSEHPLAKAVVDACGINNVYPASNIQPLQGIGISADVNGKKVVVMSYKSALDTDVDMTSLNAACEATLALGNTVTIVLVDGVAAGVLTFSDTIRTNAASVMTELSSLGLKTVMLTGDNGRSAQYIAALCNIGEIRHDLMPEDKLKAIDAFQQDGHKVLMVGDGINDAPSLKLASCSIAMGAMGSDIAIETADMAILNSDIAKVADEVRLARRVMRRIKFNIMLGLTISVAAVILSGFGLLTPGTGALVHNCTSVLVVASSALLLYNRKKKSPKAL